MPTVPRVQVTPRVKLSTPRVKLVTLTTQSARGHSAASVQHHFRNRVRITVARSSCSVYQPLSLSFSSDIWIHPPCPPSPAQPCTLESTIVVVTSLPSSVFTVTRLPTQNLTHTQSHLPTRTTHNLLHFKRRRNLQIHDLPVLQHNLLVPLHPPRPIHLLFSSTP